MRTTIATRANLGLFEENYQRWLADPTSVESSWAAFFEGFELGNLPQRNGATVAAAPRTETGAAPLLTRVDGLVYAYRTLGHTIALLDPLATKRPENPLFNLRELGFSEKDLDLRVSSRFFLDNKEMTLREMIALLGKIYADTIGSEFMHIQNSRIRNWVRHRLEARPERKISSAVQLALLRALLEAESFEVFLHSRYVGQKRFSLQGAEALMVMLDTILHKCPRSGVEEICMGMAHRGRLNVLANFLRKSLKIIFTEFSENYIPDLVAGDGDVKYHLGYHTERKLRSGDKIEIRLSANPSHLEAVDPIVEGTARARQRRRGDTEHRRKVLPLLIHGDAAFAGQGMVAETLNMSQLPGYSTGGTVHLVVNNQIGFTTLPEDARSSMYATDIAKMIEVPIFHVNGEDPEAVNFVSETALDFRQEFGRDVVIDMYCYRKYGHQEVDEPSFTQPDLYAKIDKRPSAAQLYKRRLLASGVLSDDDAASLEIEFDIRLELAQQEVKAIEKEKAGKQAKFEESTAVFQPEYTSSSAKTAVTKKTLATIVDAITSIPEDFHVVPKVKRMLVDRRREVFEAGGPYDWGFAEALAFGSLLLDGNPVRLSGQDSRRGTFGQRHAVLFDATTGEPYVPLSRLASEKAGICIYNSLLSEAAVLGFDYGYSLDFPEMLCLWEAQFGDFANGAQVIIDQFIVSAESKWQRPSGIVLLLPHGYEGQGPEHSSARIERFLQACAEDNIQVINPTTPAQYFHALRRQMKRDFVKPLVIATPKSLLRADYAASREEDFTSGQFEEILASPKVGSANKIKRVILCSGKVYYDLLNYRTEKKIDSAAIIRVEQLYPFAEKKLRDTLKPFPKTAKLVWCQEESQNMGAWTFIEPRLRSMFKREIAYAGRGASASPAVGALAIHKREQGKLISQAFSA